MFNACLRGEAQAHNHNRFIIRDASEESIPPGVFAETTQGLTERVRSSGPTIGRGSCLPALRLMLLEGKSRPGERPQVIPIPPGMPRSREVDGNRDDNRDDRLRARLK